MGIQVRRRPSGRLATRTRCPFCHAGLDAEHDDWVQCAACRALEHRACWLEHGRCAACRADVRTGEPPPPRFPRVAAPPARRIPPPSSWSRLDPLARLSVSGALSIAGAVLLLLAVHAPGAPGPSAGREPYLVAVTHADGSCSLRVARRRP